MSNLAIFEIEPSAEYQSVSTLSELTFEAGRSYQIQIRGAATFCESSTKPTEGGFFIDSTIPFTWNCTGDDLWILPARSSTVNIAE